MMHTDLVFDTTAKNREKEFDVFHTKMMQNVKALRDGLIKGYVLTSTQERISFLDAVCEVMDVMGDNDIVSLLHRLRLPTGDYEELECIVHMLYLFAREFPVPPPEDADADLLFLTDVYAAVLKNEYDLKRAEMIDLLSEYID